MRADDVRGLVSAGRAVGRHYIQRAADCRPGFIGAGRNRQHFSGRQRHDNGRTVLGVRVPDTGPSLTMFRQKTDDVVPDKFRYFGPGFFEQFVPAENDDVGLRRTGGLDAPHDFSPAPAIGAVEDGAARDQPFRVPVQLVAEVGEHLRPFAAIGGQGRFDDFPTSEHVAPDSFSHGLSGRRSSSIPFRPRGVVRGSVEVTSYLGAAAWLRRSPDGEDCSSGARMACAARSAALSAGPAGLGLYPLRNDDTVVQAVPQANHGQSTGDERRQWVAPVVAAGAGGVVQLDRSADCHVQPQARVHCRGPGFGRLGVDGAV